MLFISITLCPVMWFVFVSVEVFEVEVSFKEVLSYRHSV